MAGHLSGEGYFIAHVVLNFQLSDDENETINCIVFSLPTGCPFIACSGEVLPITLSLVSPSSPIEETSHSQG